MLRFSLKLSVFLLFVAVLTSTCAQDATNSSTDATTAAAATTEGAIPIPISPATSSAGAVEQRKKYLSLDDEPTCKQQDAKLNECLNNLFETSLKRLRAGDKELNIPALDPFLLNKTTIQAAVGPVKGRLILRNSLVAGFGDSKFKSLDFKTDNVKTYLHYVAHVPAVRVWGDYKADVTVNNAHMRPKGTFNVTLSDVNIANSMEGEFYEQDGHRFVRIVKFDAEPTVGDVKFNATGIFPDPTLNDLVVNILNQYWREIYRVLLPETRKFWGPLVVRVLNEAMSVVPYDNFVKD